MAVSNASTSTATNTADREIVITRVFDAPRELVFDAWIDPQHVASWWGPKGFTTTIHHMDVRPGGEWRFIMHGPDGIDYPNKIVYLEIARPERLVYDHGDEGDPAHFRATVTFEKQGDKTRLTMRSLFRSAAARDEVVTKYHAIEGGNQTLDRFGEHLAKRTAALSAPSDLVMTRLFDAPRPMVFKAWTDPERLKRWWGPRNFTNPVCELDPRPGGAILIHMRAPDGKVHPMTGTFREIVPPELLVFTSSALDPAGNPLFEVLTTITLSEESGKTRLTVRASVTMVTKEAAQHLAGMEQGWSQSLDRLAQVTSA